MLRNICQTTTADLPRRRPRGRCASPLYRFRTQIREFLQLSASNFVDPTIGSRPANHRNLTLTASPIARNENMYSPYNGSNIKYKEVKK